MSYYDHVKEKKKKQKRKFFYATSKKIFKSFKKSFGNRYNTYTTSQRIMSYYDHVKEKQKESRF